ncbi:MAG: aspartate 1-decarboxylase [candidate division WOR-3 bacterium]
MLRSLLKSKIHQIKVTDKNLNYEGSLTIDEDILKKADMIEGEMVQVVNITNGNRWETYLMKGKKGSGECILNGGTARLGEVGDKLIVLSFVFIDTTQARSFIAKKVFLDENNRIIKTNNALKTD